jgi:hypothetical protein
VSNHVPFPHPHARCIALLTLPSPLAACLFPGSSDFAIIATEGFWRVMSYGGARITLLEHFAAGGAKADASYVLKTEALVQSAAKGESNHDIAIAVLFF